MTIRKKNKFVALLLALLLAVGMLPVPVMAAGSFTLEVGSVTAELKAGETVEVPITATANSGYVAGVLDVSWDKTALELTDVKYSQTLAPKGNSAPIPTNNPGKYTIDFGNNVATENYTGTGEFFKLVFKITDTAAAGDHAISLSGFQIYDFDVNELTVTSNPGKVTLTGGSSSGDGVVIPTFDDVAEDTYYFDAVLWAVENGVTNGMDATHFAPNDKCTRAQVVTFLWRAVGSPEPTSSHNPFVDVIEGKFYYKAVLWAVEEGITNGVDATHFGTNDECTRGHVATFLWRTLGKPSASSSTNPFTDVAQGKFYYEAVLWAAESGVTTGISAGKFAPSGTCTRGQIVTFLYRALNDK